MAEDPELYYLLNVEYLYRKAKGEFDEPSEPSE